jgi:hypothetical protein
VQCQQPVDPHANDEDHEGAFYLRCEPTPEDFAHLRTSHSLDDTYL